MKQPNQLTCQAANQLTGQVANWPWQTGWLTGQLPVRFTGWLTGCLAKPARQPVNRTGSWPVNKQGSRPVNWPGGQTVSQPARQLAGQLALCCQPPCQQTNHSSSRLINWLPVPVSASESGAMLCHSDKQPKQCDSPGLYSGASEPCDQSNQALGRCWQSLNHGMKVISNKVRQGTNWQIG